MAKSINDIDRIIKQLANISNKVAKEAAPKIDKLFKESVRYAIMDFYASYEPMSYERTLNFMKVTDSANTTVSKNIITLSVNNDLMNDYPGFSNKPLSKDTAFDFMFQNGEHGHGKYLMAVSTSPLLQIENDIDSMFAGRAEKILIDAQNKILNSIF